MRTTSFGENLRVEDTYPPAKDEAIRDLDLAMKSIIAFAAVVALGFVIVVLRPAKAAPSPSLTHNLNSTPARLDLSLPQIEQGKFRLYKYQALVGEENYEVARAGDSLILKSDFNLSYLGTKVSLASQLRAQADWTPQHLELKGDTSTQSHIDLSIDVNGRTAVVRDGQETKTSTVPGRYFTVDGYAPLSVQMMMARYWFTGGGKGRLATVPDGDVTFEDRGSDTIEVAGQHVRLERYSVGGVIWGRETLWFDDARRLIAAIMVDAEQDRFEAVLDGYQSSLKFFVTKAAQDSVALLARMSIGLAPRHKGTFAITGATVIDVVNGTSIPDAVVVIEGNRIAAVGPHAKVKIPKGAGIVDARGKTLLPGLWEMHAHYVQVELGPAYLAAGVTMARDCGNDFDFIVPVRDALNTGNELGPRLLLAGYVDGEGEAGLGVMRAKTAEEARAIVNRYHSAGFEQIKIYGNATLSPEVVAAIAAEAHRLGMTVTGHVPRGMNAIQAVEAGYDQINHLGFITRVLFPKGYRSQPGGPLPRIDFDSDDVKRAIQFFKDHGTVIDPTLSRGEFNSHQIDTPFSVIEPGMLKAPRELAEILNHTGVPAAAAERARAFSVTSRAVLLALQRAGIPIVAGIDLVLPGHSLHHELELYVKAGLTPMEALRTATIVPARVMKRDAEVGSIATGKRADLIIVDGNPLAEISNIRKVTQVVAGGKLYDCAQLWRIAGFQP